MTPNPKNSRHPKLTKIIDLIKDKTLRREIEIPTYNYDVRFQLSKIKKIKFEPKKVIATREIFNIKIPSVYKYTMQDISSFETAKINYTKKNQKGSTSLTFSVFKTLKTAKVGGYNYKKSLKNRDTIFKKRDKGVMFKRVQSEPDVYHLALPSLHTLSTFNYNTLIDFPENKSLLSFQRDGVAFLLEQENALLADEMGLGKSIQAIIATRLLFKFELVKNCLIVCPKSVLEDWETKFEEWAKELKTCKISGKTSTRDKLWTRKAHVYLVTYDTLREDVLTDEERKFESNFDLVILDEIQRIKNSSTKTFQAINKIRGIINWGLSGTPLENRVEDLTTIFSYLKPGLFNAVEVGDPALVKTVVKPFVLRRTKSAVLRDLPEKIHDRVLLDLDSKQRAVYDLIEKQGIIHLKEQGQKATVTHVLALISKLKQICNIEPVSGESSKLEYLKDMLTNLSELRDKMLVFSQYPEKTLKLIEPRLRNFNPLIYHGLLTSKQRQEILKQFKEDESVKVMLISLKAGGLGLTLTDASYVTHFDFWWNPAVMSQAEDRTHRIGQKKTVFVTSLITKNTVEERIQRILEEKRTLFREVVGEISNYRLIGLLTEKELFGLFGVQRIKAQKNQRTHKDRL